MSAYIKHEDGQTYDFVGMLEDNLVDLKHTLYLLRRFASSDTALDVTAMDVSSAVARVNSALDRLKRDGRQS